MDRRFSILVADESEDFRASLRDALTPEGYDLVDARTGREAIDVIRSQPVHIVVMEVRLPDYSGLEIYHAIKQIRDTFLPCIFTAFETTPRSLQEALREDAVTIFPKPVDLPRLVHAVDWSVERFYSRRSGPRRPYPRRFTGR